jgi:DNA-directed RNA polymerase specialized sigma24 family protein
MKNQAERELLEALLMLSYKDRQALMSEAEALLSEAEAEPWRPPEPNDIQKAQTRRAVRARIKGIPPHCRAIIRAQVAQILVASRRAQLRLV